MLSNILGIVFLNYLGPGACEVVSHWWKTLANLMVQVSTCPACLNPLKKMDYSHDSAVSHRIKLFIIP